MRAEKIGLGKIRIDGGTQPRTELNQEVVSEYAENIDRLPPGRAMFDGKVYWLFDGFHRFFAHKAAKRTTMMLEVTEGAQRDAKLASLSANADHGLRRTQDDKRKAVTTTLTDPEWSLWSNHKIAEVCLVSHKFVASVRDSLPKPDAQPAPTTVSPDVIAKIDAIQSVGGIGRIVERTNPRTGKKQVYAQNARHIGGSLPLTERRKVLASPKLASVLDKDQAESLAQATKGVTLKGMKAIAAGLANGTPVQQVMERFQPNEDEPWRAFNATIDDIVADVRAVSRKLSELFDVDPATKKIGCRWAQFYGYTGTIGWLNTFAKQIDAGKPYCKSDDKPGFMTRQMAIEAEKTKAA